MKNIREFLGLKRIALVGVSRDRRELSRVLLRDLLARGYDVVPVHPEAASLEGRTCSARLADIQPPVEGALFMTPPAVTDRLVRECADAGIHRVWLFRGGGQGSATADTVRFCKERGLTVVAGECPFMFLPRSGLVHRVHGLVRRVCGSYPRERTLETERL